MTKILVVHGAGINMRGKSQVEIFGTDTMEDYSNQIKKYADELKVTVDIYHSNIEAVSYTHLTLTTINSV